MIIRYFSSTPLEYDSGELQSRAGRALMVTEKLEPMVQLLFIPRAPVVYHKWQEIIHSWFHHHLFRQRLCIAAMKGV